MTAANSFCIGDVGLDTPWSPDLSLRRDLVDVIDNPTLRCMRTRSQARRLRQQQLHQQQVPPNLVELPIVTMADNRTMAELLQAPTEGYEDAIVVPEIEAANFEIKHGLLTLVQNKQFFGHDKEDPHAHIRYFNKITSTLRYPNVPTTSIKLMLFPFSLEGAARIWLEKEPPRSIQTWDDLVAKFINQFFPPSKTTNLRNEITNFKQRFDESFSEAWDRFKDLLRACPHHGFSELHQLDTFYNALNVNDQDSLNSAAGGNFLDKRPADCSSIIERLSITTYQRTLLADLERNDHDGGGAEEWVVGGVRCDMVLMIDSVVMWMMVEGGVARLEWSEISPDNGREEWEAPDCYREREGCISFRSLFSAKILVMFEMIHINVLDDKVQQRGGSLAELMPVDGWNNPGMVYRIFSSEDESTPLVQVCTSRLALQTVRDRED
ncbi:reverse transcriptase domain-containing protein [Tanacetum coccineum]|uniref:Reverse transcriptase domain-containing protein n=1 Tax=Tanacetum coccineum TaxID=301880 RepID=A0ABQ4YJ65_9ASTR